MTGLDVNPKHINNTTVTPNIHHLLQQIPSVLSSLLTTSTKFKTI